MKKLLTVILFLSYLTCLVGNATLEELKIEAKRLEKTIEQKADSLKLTKGKITELENNNILNKYRLENNFNIEAEIRSAGNIKDGYKPSSKIIGKLKINEKIQLIDYKRKYWHIKYGSIIGYTLYSNIVEN